MVSLLLNLELVATAIIARVFLRENIGRALLVVGACVCVCVDNAVAASLDSYSPARITLTKGVVAGSVNVLLGESLTVTLAVAFAVSLTGVLIVGSAHHGHAHTHEVFEHAHPIDATDSHHSLAAIEVLSGSAHRHLVLAHQHEHLPDIHRRHDH